MEEMKSVRIIRGYELMEELCKGQIEDGQKFKMFREGKKDLILRWNEKAKELEVTNCLEKPTDYEKMSCEYLVIPEQVEIQNISELDEKNSDTMNEVAIIRKVNEVIKGLKQLDMRYKLKAKKGED